MHMKQIIAMVLALLLVLTPIMGQEEAEDVDAEAQADAELDTEAETGEEETIVETETEVEAETEIEAGVTPDSFLWGIDVALDRIKVALERNPQSRAEKGLLVAQERLLEIKAMAEAGEFEAAEKARDEHGRALGKVEEAVEDVEDGDASEELENKLRIELKVKEHKERVEDVETELEIKIRGQLTDEQWQMILSLIEELSSQADSVDIKIRNEEAKARVKIEQEGLDADDVEDELEEKLSVDERKAEHAEKMKTRAQNKWDDLEVKAEKLGVDVPSAEEFEALLAEAEALFAAGDFEAAKDTYEEAKDLAEELKESLEEGDEDNVDVGEDDDEDDSEEGDEDTDASVDVDASADVSLDSPRKGSGRY